MPESKTRWEQEFQPWSTTRACASVRSPAAAPLERRAPAARREVVTLRSTGEGNRLGQSGPIWPPLSGRERHGGQQGQFRLPGVQAGVLDYDGHVRHDDRRVGGVSLYGLRVLQVVEAQVNGPARADGHPVGSDGLPVGEEERHLDAGVFVSRVEDARGLVAIERPAIPGAAGRDVPLRYDPDVATQCGNCVGSVSHRLPPSRMLGGGREPYSSRLPQELETPLTCAGATPRSQEGEDVRAYPRRQVQLRALDHHQEGGSRPLRQADA